MAEMAMRSKTTTTTTTTTMTATFATIHVIETGAMNHVRFQVCFAACDHSFRW
jgi:hypothetical protein